MSPLTLALAHQAALYGMLAGNLLQESMPPGKRRPKSAVAQDKARQRARLAQQSRKKNRR